MYDFYRSKLIKNLFGYLSYLLISLSLLFFPQLSFSQDSALIIFDASGSMTGKIDGKEKIVIARDVMGTLLKDWNEDINVGLMAYGHRKKGSCDDIEILLPVSKVNNKKILAKINTISPKGKTPMTAALSQAAKTLRYTEDPATVILISDGEETCHADPCVISKELEEKGINFTTHVIGFDIEDNQKAREQLQCIAKNTGGQFFEAKDADSLKAALEKVAKVAAEPEVKPVPKKKPVKVAEESNLPFKDDFEREALGDHYEVDKPDEDRMAISEGGLLIIGTSPIKNIVKVKQKISGNFAASVKININLTENNEAGIRYIFDDKNSLTLGYSVNSINTGTIFFRKIVKGKHNTSFYNKDIGKRSLNRHKRKQEEDWYFKIEKKGFKFKAYASIDGEKWVNVGEHALLKKNGQIALIVEEKGIENPIVFDDLMIKAMD